MAALEEEGSPESLATSKVLFPILMTSIKCFKLLDALVVSKLVFLMVTRRNS